MLKPLIEAGVLPARSFTIPELAELRRAGYLTIHDNGVLTVQLPGEPPVEVAVPLKDRHRQKSTSDDFPQ